MDRFIPNLRCKRLVLARRTNLNSFHTFQHLILTRLPSRIRNSISLVVWAITWQKKDHFDSFGEQVNRRIHLGAKSVIAFFFEIGALALGYYVYLGLNGVSVTGNWLADLLLPTSLIMLFVVNVALISKWPVHDTEETMGSTEMLNVSPTKKEQALKFLKVLGSLSSNQLASLLEVDVRNLSKFINPFIQTGIIAVKKEGKTYIYSLKNPHTFALTHNRHTSQEETDYASQNTLPNPNLQLPSEGNVLGRVALDDW